MGLSLEVLKTDVLIIGGGTSGCFSAITLAERNENVKVIITEKANIKRSGCLAAGVNAINAYLTEGETENSFVDYVKIDSEGVVREDLVYTIAQRLNKVTEKIEKLGLPILKDQEGRYIARGRGSIKINGENIKPLLANEVLKHKNINVLNKVNVVDYIIKDGRVIGAYAFSIDEPKFFVIYAKAVICATGGTSGLYKPNNSGFSKHKMWYSPFNTGAGYAMGIRAGAEMTTFEMRFIALRCKDTIAPTGTVAQGVKTFQVNNLGEQYVKKYGKPSTPIRLYSTVMENSEGRGPCYLKTKGITDEQQEELFKAYLNMAPAQTLKWIENGTGPSNENIEVEGTEPYIVGGHTGSGYWIDKKRRTTINGLFAAGDVAGGSPKKYVTGCFAEGEIAAEAALEYIEGLTNNSVSQEQIENKLREINKFLSIEDYEAVNSYYSVDEVEASMQKVMDEYAGGISKNYCYNAEKLNIALKRIDELMDISRGLKARNLHELLFIHEVIDRLYVGKVLIHHLMARKETRWRCYQENLDYQYKDDSYLKYINSVYKDEKVNIIFRELIGRTEEYEHKN